MKSLTLLALIFPLCSLVRPHPIESEPSDGFHDLVARGRGNNNGGGSSSRRPPVEYIDPETHDPISGKPWGRGANSREYIERLRTERLPDRIDGGFRPRLSRTPEEGATGFYRRPSKYSCLKKPFTSFIAFFLFYFFAAGDSYQDLCIDRLVDEHVRTYFGDAAPYHRSTLEAHRDFYPDSIGKVYDVAPNNVRNLNRARSLEFAEQYPGTTGDEKVWASLNMERNYAPKNLRKKYKDIPQDHPDRDHTYDRRRIDSIVGRVPKHESDAVEFHLANQAGREAKKYGVGIELIPNPSDRTRHIKSELIYAPSGHPKWGEPVVSTGRWAPPTPDLLPQPMPRYISRSPPADRPLTRPDLSRSRSPRDYDLVEITPGGSSSRRGRSRASRYDDDEYLKRDIIGGINGQENSNSSSQPNEESLYQEYVAAMEVIQGNASAILFPFLNDMINGSNSSLVYEAAWAVQSNMISTDEVVIGPFWGGGNSFQDWEDQWLLTHGFYIADDGSIVVPSNYTANQTRVTNDTVRELKDMLAVNAILLDKYEAAYNNGSDAVNATNLLGLLDDYAYLLDTNDTSIIPSNELSPNTLTTGADDKYFTNGAAMRQNWTDWSNATASNGSDPSIAGTPMNLTSVLGSSNGTMTELLNQTAGNSNKMRRAVALPNVEAAPSRKRTVQLNRRDAEIHLNGLHEELYKRHSAGEKDIGLFFEWVSS